jgi:hypothetical protein
MNHRATNDALRVNIAVAVNAGVSISFSEGAQANDSAPVSNDEATNGIVVTTPQSANSGQASGPLASGTSDVGHQVGGDIV